MGMLIEGQWHDRGYDTKSSWGRFVRQQSSLRDWVRADDSTRFAREAGRYHLYVSLACPWAHRTLIFRKLKNLEAAISLSVVEPAMGAEDWKFGSSEGTVPDSVNGARHLRGLHQMPGIAETVNFSHIRRHCYQSHRSINPAGVVPLGPELDLAAPHGRDHL
jgi:putative glutathione S-transferase